MAIIDAKGLFSGDRLSMCSDEAQLHWVRLYSSANGFARLELNYRKVVAAAYSGFKRPPSEVKFWSWVKEYREHYLLFVYEAANGVLWGQWNTDERHLPRYKTADDRRSPAPPAKQLQIFIDEYQKMKQQTAFPKFLENIPSYTEPFQSVHIGDGVGGGVGEGKTNAPAEVSPNNGAEQELEEPIGPSAAVSGLMDMAGLRSRDGRVVLEAMARDAQRQGKNLISWAETLARSWKEFAKARPKLKYAWGAEKFFGEGHYEDPDGWPWKDGQQSKRKLKTVSE